MSIIHTIDSDTITIGGHAVSLGDHVGHYADADETTGYDVELIDGSRIADDRDRDELRDELRALGYDTETDDTGLVLVRA